MESAEKERLKEFLKFKGIGQTKFEAAAGLPRGYVNNIRRSITPEKLLTICLYFPDLNQVWLKTGEGDIPKDTISEALGHSHGARVTGVYIKYNRDKVDEANRKVLDYVKE